MKFCSNCGAQLPDDTQFCGSCGTPVAAAQPAQPAQAPAPDPGMYTQAPPPYSAPAPAPSPEQLSGAVQLCQDGVYRWVYELSMLKNPAILITLLKIFGGVIGGIWLLMNIADGFDSFVETTKIMAIVLAGLCVLTLLSYLIVAALFGGKYCCLFEMDEQQIAHVQLPRQFKKAQVAGWIAMLAGVIAGNPAATGAGILAASRNKLTNKFSKVRSIKAAPSRNTIYVKGTLKSNQIYVDDAYFQFVLDFLRSHCPNAR